MDVCVKFTTPLNELTNAHKQFVLYLTKYIPWSLYDIVNYYSLKNILHNENLFDASASDYCLFVSCGKYVSNYVTSYRGDQLVISCSTYYKLFSWNEIDNSNVPCMPRTLETVFISSVSSSSKTSYDHFIIFDIIFHIHIKGVTLF